MLLLKNNYYTSFYNGFIKSFYRSDRKNNRTYGIRTFSSRVSKTFNSLFINFYLNKLVIYRSYPGGNNQFGHVFKLVNKGLPKAPQIPLQHTQTGEAKNSASLSISSSDVSSSSISSIPSTEAKSSKDAKSVFSSLDRYFKPYPKENTSMVSSVKDSNLPSDGKISSYSHILTVNSPHVLQHKESILEATKFFDKIPENKLSDPIYLLEYFKSLVKENPTLVCNRGFQLTFEICFKRRRMDETTLKAVFDNSNLSFKDIVGNNESLVDISSVYTGYQTQYLLSLEPFKEVNAIAIITPLNMFKIQELSLAQQTVLESSQRLTGNICCDVMLDGVYYDFKNAKDIQQEKNHIYSLIYEEIQESVKIQRYFKFLIERFSNGISNNDFESKGHKLLLVLIKDLSSSPLEKLNKWNSFLAETLYSRPPEIKIPIIIPTSTKPFKPISSEEDLNKVLLPISKSLDPRDVNASLRELALTWDSKKSNNAFHETCGIFGKPYDDNSG